VYEGTVNTSTYPDGPNLPSDLRSRIKVALDTDDAAVKAPQGPSDLLGAVLADALPILEEHAADERAFWGTDDRQGLARDAEQLYGRAKDALAAALRESREIAEKYEARYSSAKADADDQARWAKHYADRCESMESLMEDSGR
jgi:hypothetical protein